MSDGNGSFLTKIDLVSQRLRDEIARGHILPGERLRQAEIAQRVGVSLAPVREALRTLEAKGLVEFDPHRGARVVPITIRDVEEVAFIRKLLESEAVRLACAQVTPALIDELRTTQAEMERELAQGNMARVRALNHAFHLAIYEAAGQQRLVALIASVLDSFPWEQIPRVRAHMHSFISEHTPIIDTLEQGDADQLVRLQRDHIDHWRETIIANFFSSDGTIKAQAEGVS